MIYLHIGRHKTGTSALQRFLAANRRRLMRRGYEYPEPLRHHSAHHDLALALNPRRMREASIETRFAAERELDRMRGLLQQPGDKVISSEAFQNLDPTVLQNLFPVGQTTVIVYLREQLDYLLSAYAQMIQAQPVRTPFADHAAQFKPDYAVFLDKWAAVFGKQNLRVRIYDRSVLQEGDIRGDFLQAMDLMSWRFRFSHEHVNPSIGPELIEFKGLLNGIVPASMHRELRLYTLLGRLAKQSPSRMTVSPGFAERFRSRFAEANARVVREYTTLPFPMNNLGDCGSSVGLQRAVNFALAGAEQVAPRSATRLKLLLPGRIEDAGLCPLLPGDWSAAEAALSR